METNTAMWHNMPVNELIPKLADALSICAGALAFSHPDSESNQEMKAAQSKALEVLQACEYEAWELCSPKPPST